MKTILLTSVGVMCVGVACVIAEPRDLDTRIASVTVFADRALVTREGAVKVSEGLAQAAILKLPAWIDAGSIRAEVLPKGSAEIVDVQVRKEFQATPQGEDIQGATAALREIEDQLGSISDRMSLLAARREQVDKISTFNIEKLPRDAVTRDIPVEHFKDMVEFVSSEQEQILTQTRELEKQQRELGPERDARAKRLGELQKLAQLEFSSIVFTLQAKAPADVTLKARYMTPGATWEPVHEMRIEAGDHVRFVSSARIRQTTGEDWNGADIAVSTQSPSKALNIPKLEALLVGATTVNPILQSNMPVDGSFAAANQYFVGNNIWMNAANGVVAGKRAQDLYASNFAEQLVRQRVSSETFAKLQDRGTTAIFQAVANKAVRSDGMPVQLVIGQQLLTSTPLLVAAPEVSLNVTRTLNLTNTGERPILPGQVSLFLDGAFVGSTTVEFVGVGEEFAMFAGLADEVKISRVLDHDKSTIVRGRKTNKITAAFVIKVENLSDEAKVIRLADRIPVSDEKLIRVSGVTLNPKADPGDDGLLLWEVTVAPKSAKDLLIAYTVEYPVDIRGLRKSSMSSTLDGAPSSATDSAVQIINLESMF